MKVNVTVLERVYESLQGESQREDHVVDRLDPDNHLFIIDAFEMPRWHWSPERGTFERFVDCLDRNATPTPDPQIATGTVYIRQCRIKGLG